jgi:hypothetical protein
MQASDACEGQPAAPRRAAAPAALKCGQGVRTVYWVQNGEVLAHEEEEYERFEELRDGLEPLLVDELGDEFGYFADAIYVAPHPQRKHGLEIFVERKWVPAFGYAWSEVQVKRIEVW